MQRERERSAIPALNYATYGHYVGLCDEDQRDIEREEFEAGTDNRLPKCDSLRLNTHKRSY